jgi:hypothetical protein
MSAVLTVKSNLDPHMIIELMDNKSRFDDLPIVCLSGFT